MVKYCRGLVTVGVRMFLGGDHIMRLSTPDLQRLRSISFPNSVVPGRRSSTISGADSHRLVKAKLLLNLLETTDCILWLFEVNTG